VDRKISENPLGRRKIPASEWLMEIRHGIDNKDREHRIAEAAYFRAERRGFVGGDPVADWIDAEHEIDAELRRQEHGRLLAELESRLEAASKKLGALKKKATNVTAEARKEIEQDVQKLARLRDTFEKRIEEIRAQSVEAGHRAKEHAEALWAEISAVVDRVARRPRQRKP
jgi:DNA repair exonuclease SbcCD ATPase subunit